jgi:hypothetical protein
MCALIAVRHGKSDIALKVRIDEPDSEDLNAEIHLQSSSPNLLSIKHWELTGQRNLLHYPGKVN